MGLWGDSLHQTKITNKYIAILIQTLYTHFPQIKTTSGYGSLLMCLHYNSVKEGGIYVLWSSNWIEIYFYLLNAPVSPTISLTTEHILYSEHVTHNDIKLACSVKKMNIKFIKWYRKVSSSTWFLKKLSFFQINLIFFFKPYLLSIYKNVWQRCSNSPNNKKPWL